MEYGFQRNDSNESNNHNSFNILGNNFGFQNNNFSSSATSSSAQSFESTSNIIRSEKSRSHNRSASWSPTTILQRQNCQSSALESSSSSSAEGRMASSIFSPIRGAIQGIVPGLAETVAAAGGTRVPPTPGFMPPMNAAGVNNESHIASAGSRHNSTSSMRHISGHARSRSDISSRHHSRQSSTVEIDINSDIEPTPSTAGSQQENGIRNDNMEFLGTITWVERAIPFLLLLLTRIMWDHRLGILVFVGLFGTFFHVNSTIRKQVALKDKRLHRVSLGILLFLFANIFAIYYVFNSQNLHYCLMFSIPNLPRMDIWTVFWCVGITDFIVRFVTMAIKCLVILTPRKLMQFRKRGKYFLMIENLSQFYRMTLPARIWYQYFINYDIGGEYFALLSTTVYIVLKARMLFVKFKECVSAFTNMCKDMRYGRTPSKEVLMELGDSCPICQEEMEEPIELNLCKHIFCEDCIGMWFDRERTCPMCRAKVAEDPQWRDGSTQMFIQFF